LARLSWIHPRYLFLGCERVNTRYTDSVVIGHWEQTHRARQGHSPSANSLSGYN
jgi:hypothetical protein